MLGTWFIVGGTKVPSNTSDRAPHSFDMLTVLSACTHGLVVSSVAKSTASAGGLQATAQALHAEGKMMEAISHMADAVASTPVHTFEHAQRRFFLGMMWEDIGSLDEAQHLFQGLSTENGRWKTYLANVLVSASDQSHTIF